MHVLCAVFAVAVFPKRFAGKCGRGWTDIHLGVQSQQVELKVATAGKKEYIPPRLASLDYKKTPVFLRTAHEPELIK